MQSAWTLRTRITADVPRSAPSAAERLAQEALEEHKYYRSTSASDKASCCLMSRKTCVGKAMHGASGNHTVGRCLVALTTLVVGPSLSAVCMGQLAALMQRPYHAQRCAVGCCCQAPSVAVSQHPCFATAGAPGLQLSHHAVCSYPSQFLQMYNEFLDLGIVHKPNQRCVLKI